MRVSEVMCRPVSVCTEETSLASAAQLMGESDCGVLPVVRSGRLVGILTDRDVCLAVGAQWHSGATPVREIMNQEVHTCKATDDLPSALAAMAKHRVRRLPVLDEHGALKGILIIDDLVLRAEEPDPSRRPAPVSYREVVGTLQRIYGSRRVLPEAVATIGAQPSVP
jgi:CBS domain-containing protein